MGIGGFMVRARKPGAWLTGAVLLGVACSYTYTISETLDGPALELDTQVPAIQVRARACVDGASVDGVGIELRARATLDSPVGSEVRVALSRDPSPDVWDVNYQDAAVGEDGAELSLEGRGLCRGGV